MRDHFQRPAIMRRAFFYLERHFRALPRFALLERGISLCPSLR
jgi:hypothetical protein